MLKIIPVICAALVSISAFAEKPKEEAKQADRKPGSWIDPKETLFIQCSNAKGEKLKIQGIGHGSERRTYSINGKPLRDGEFLVIARTDSSSVYIYSQSPELMEPRQQLVLFRPIRNTYYVCERVLND